MTEHENIIFDLDQEEIIKLRERVRILETQLSWQNQISYEYWNGLYQIRCFVDIWRRKRIPKIREQLDSNEIILRF